MPETLWSHMLDVFQESWSHSFGTSFIHLFSDLLCARQTAKYLRLKRWKILRLCVTSWVHLTGKSKRKSSTVFPNPKMSSIGKHAIPHWERKWERKVQLPLKCPWGIASRIPCRYPNQQMLKSLTFGLCILKCRIHGYRGLMVPESYQGR